MSDYNGPKDPQAPGLEPSKNRYKVKEIFYSLQGEGYRAGTANVFVRFAGCNLDCWFCDTDFKGGEWMTAEDIEAEVVRLAGPCIPIIFTGGEPTLQLDHYLSDVLRKHYQAIETNGLRDIRASYIQWVTVSPKTEESNLALRTCSEVKYVLGKGDPLPQPTLATWRKLLSPRCVVDDRSAIGKASGSIDPDALAWCIQLCLENPQWQLSVQQHKLWNMR